MKEHDGLVRIIHVGYGEIGSRNTQEVKLLILSYQGWVGNRQEEISDDFLVLGLSNWVD